MKETMNVIVEMASDGTFGCYPELEAQDFGVAGYGDTPEEAMADFRAAYEEAREMQAQMGRPVPDYALVFHQLEEATC